MIKKFSVIKVLGNFREERQRRRLAEQQRDQTIEKKTNLTRRVEYFKWRTHSAEKTVVSQEKEIAFLKWQLYEPLDWKIARHIPWLGVLFDLDRLFSVNPISRELIKISKKVGINPRRVYYPKLGEYNIYHEEAIQHFFHKLIEDQNYMKKHRKMVG